MSRIVAVHGIGQQNEGPRALHDHWWPRMQDGVQLAGADLASEATLVCAFYGNLFRPEGHLAVGEPPFDAGDVEGWEGELLKAWWREAAQTDSGVVGPDDRTMLAAPRLIQRALNALSNSRFFAGIAEQALIFNLKQVKLYLHDAAVRQAVQQRIAKEITEDTSLIVAHSLGSVAAYEALCAHPEWPVRALVTLGSPLGIRNLIFDQLQPLPENGIGRWPGRVLMWTNITDAGDIVALEKDLRRRFGDRIENAVVNNGATAHNVGPYLTAKETGLAIARGLGLPLRRRREDAPSPTASPDHHR